MTPTVDYIREVLSNPSRRWDFSMESYLLAFKEVSVGKLRVAVENFERRQRGGLSPEDAWNMTHIELTECAEVRSSLNDTVINIKEQN